jgi:hypothetical protein
VCTLIIYHPYDAEWISLASPYLLSLGLSKSKMAIVFVAGPLSGLLVQPLIGVLQLG